ncbi:MAG: M20/M25/M40 family metallo-hydrolase, partial [Pseudomonadota bacterium]
MHWSKLGAVAAVVAAAVSGFLMVTPPRGEGLDAPADRYSAARAHALVAEFADRPHLIGSPANALVRDRIVAAFEGLGLTVETRTTRTVYDHPRRDETRTRVAWPENIIARLPGDGSRRGPGEALALMSHYDSVPTGHGAADAMSGVASIIEALRAIKASGQLLERDVVVIITDGEEVGLLGAQAFFRTNPLHEEIGLLLNFEARGAAGVASMFETGPDNAGWVREFGRAAPRPDASSVSVEIYRRMPNDTDATITLEAGIPFLNFAFIDDYFRYHAGADVAANLSQRSLQHEGDNLLALLNHFGREDWPESRSDATYFTAAPGLLVVYGSLIAWLTVIAAVALAGLAIVRLVRRNRWFNPLLGAGAVLAAVAVA